MTHHIQSNNTIILTILTNIQRRDPKRQNEEYYAKRLQIVSFYPNVPYRATPHVRRTQNDQLEISYFDYIRRSPIVFMTGHSN